MRKEHRNREEGYSLVEVLVALAILGAVLIPTAAFFVYVSNYPMNKDKIEALSLSRSEMEWTLIHEIDSDTLYRSKDNRWLIKRSVEKNQDLALISIEAFRRDTLRPPVITFKTSRIWYKE